MSAVARRCGSPSGEWVIVNTGLDRPYYFTVYLGEMTYSADINDAVRFAREQDAGAMLDHKFFSIIFTAKILADCCGILSEEMAAELPALLRAIEVYRGKVARMRRRDARIR